jgi:cytochrome c oxidase subunit II
MCPAVRAMLRRARPALAGGLVPLLLGAAGGDGTPDRHWAMDPAGPNARHIFHLWWIFFWVCAVIFVLVIAFTLAGVFRTRLWRAPAELEAPQLTPDARREKRLTNVVSGAVLVSVVLLFVLMIGDWVTARSIHSMASKDPDPLIVKVIGHQWWWELQYHDPEHPGPSDQVTGANEIHIPTGRPVKFELNSADVIHSFWLPNLSGKKDLVPGHPTSAWLQVDRPGVYDGQCAEFCGYQHAHMRLRLIAEDESAFRAWIAAQRQSAPEPSNDWQRRGQQVFLHSTCSMCHTIQGTPAGGRVGPNLTHVGGRTTLAAGTLPNTVGHLAGWIVDPQKIKPGVRMPQNNLSPEDLRGLLEYLESLK